MVIYLEHVDVDVGLNAYYSFHILVPSANTMPVHIFEFSPNTRKYINIFAVIRMKRIENICTSLIEHYCFHHSVEIAAAI